MTTLSDDTLRAQLDVHAYFHDPQYHASMYLLQRSLDETDQALERTGMPEGKRAEQLLKILAARAPDAVEARDRLADYAKKVQQLATQPARLVLSADEATALPGMAQQPPGSQWSDMPPKQMTVADGQTKPHRNKTQ